VLREPALHAALEEGGAVKAQVDQAGDGDDGEKSKKSAGGARTFFERLASALRVEVAGGFEDEEANCGENRGAGGVQDALEDVDAKNVE
jgi:hypothetical protein